MQPCRLGTAGWRRGLARCVRVKLNRQKPASSVKLTSALFQVFQVSIRLSSPGSESASHSVFFCKVALYWLSGR